jgi:hypothetical protein
MLIVAGFNRRVAHGQAGVTDGSREAGPRHTISPFCTLRRSADDIVSCAPEWIDLRVATACDLRTV